MNIYIANIAFKAKDNDLRQLFSQYGEVTSVKIVTDRDTGRSRGFGFIEMSDSEEAKTAIRQLNGYNLMERDLVVSEAKPREERNK